MMIRNGTAGGTLIIVLAHISSDDIIKTILLAAIGATVSFGLSLLLNKAIMKKKERRKKS